jgi:[ribosomal protein S18]-alanine N-acetyltransferase
VTEPGDLSIEPFTVAHLDSVLEIERRSFTDPWTRGMFRSELEVAPFTYARVALADGIVVGYLLALIIPHEAHLGNLAVHPGRRRRGIAQRLLDDLLGSSRREGAVRVTLEVRESNAAARNFYSRNNFIDVAVRKNYYRNPIEDAIVMLCRLPEDPSG